MTQRNRGFLLGEDKGWPRGPSRRAAGWVGQLGGAVGGLIAVFFCLVAAAPQATRHGAGPAAHAALVDGQQIYQEHCETCHGAEGQGVPGVYPPLAGSGWVTGDKGRLLRIILHGMQGEMEVSGTTYSNRMPAWGSILDDDQVAQVATYVRTHWGNHASEVSVNEVRRVRAATAERTQPWTAALLASEAHQGIPEVALEEEQREPSGASSGHPYPIELPELYRTFMPESSPASIAVGLPGGESYCFDAGVGYIRYAWRGGFVDNTKQWDGNGNAFTEIVGEVYYRNRVGFPLRVGENRERPEVEFEGYRLVGEGYPEFRYTANEVAIRELVRPLSEEGGLVRRFEVDPAGQTLWFMTGGEETGISFEASAGTWEGNALRLSPAQAEQFTITMTRTGSSER